MNRRRFIKGAAAALALLLVGDALRELPAAAKVAPRPDEPELSDPGPRGPWWNPDGKCEPIYAYGPGIGASPLEGCIGFMAFYSETLTDDYLVAVSKAMAEV